MKKRRQPEGRSRTIMADPDAVHGGSRTLRAAGPSGQRLGSSPPDGRPPIPAGPRLALRLGAAILGRVRRYDAVLVPGAAAAGRRLPPFVLDRLEAAQALAGDAPIIPLSAHTFHRPPPLDPAGFPVLESIAAARALLRRRAGPAHLGRDRLARHHRQRLLRPRHPHRPGRAARLLVVNSEFHMPRTRMVFDWVFGLPPAEPPYALDYHTVPDRGLTEAGLEARRAKEAARMEDLRRTIPRIASLAALHRWLFTEHRAYAAGADPRSDAPPAAALDS